jgi:phosphoribosylformimino-5-aminoimidazole carboxamide ribotide isomerase
MRLIPAIDLKAGRCVRLYQGNFDAQTLYPVQPGELMARYRDLGADWLHIVDLDGARDGTLANRNAIVELAAAQDMQLQAGGGLRNTEAVQTLLAAGVSRAIIGSAAVTSPDLVRAWLTRFGAERLGLAFDVRFDEHAVPRLATHGWRNQSQQSLWDAIQYFLGAGLKHVLCTDVSRDGALSGPNVELYEECVTRFPGIAWQASGGIRDASDLQDLARIGVAAAISGRALLENRMKSEELKPFLPNA